MCVGRRRGIDNFSLSLSRPTRRRVKRTYGDRLRVDSVDSFAPHREESEEHVRAHGTLVCVYVRVCARERAKKYACMRARKCTVFVAECGTNTGRRENRVNVNPSRGC